MANEPSREQYIHNLREHLKSPLKPEFTKLINPDIVIPFEHGFLGLKDKGSFQMFEKKGNIEAEFADFCQYLHQEMPSIGLVNIEECSTAMQHPGEIDAEGYAKVHVKDYAGNQDFIIELRITRVIKNGK